MPTDDTTKRLVWVRCGGRCVICNRYLLEDHLEDGNAVRAVGEVAHVAGESEKGPRGASSKVPSAGRNDAENLILLCPTDHRSADKRRLADPIFTEEYLFGRKARHEAFIRFVTGLRDGGRTTVIRAFGTVRGAPGVVPHADVSMAVMRHTLMTPEYLVDPRGIGLEIDLHGIPEPVDERYWETALRQIEASLARVHRHVAEGAAHHLSFFALAYVPLLVAMGNVLDDTIPFEVYERHRSSQSWAWDPAAQTVSFGSTLPSEVRDGTSEACLIVNASGTVQPGELPSDLKALPTFTIAPVDAHDPGPATFDNHDTLVSFRNTVVGFFAALERSPALKAIKTLHVFAAVPVSAAITLGRSLPVDNAAPTLALYHRTEGAYERAFDIPLSKDTR